MFLFISEETNSKIRSFRMKSFMALETVLQNVDFDLDRQTCPTCTRARHEAH